MTRFETHLLIATWGAPIAAALLMYIVAHLRWVRRDGLDRGDERWFRPLPSNCTQMSSRYDVPPHGSRLEFDHWCRIITDEVRRYLPDVRASVNRRGDRVTLRYRGQLVTCMNSAGCFLIKLDPRFGGLQDFERRDEFTARTFGKTIVGHLEPKFSDGRLAPSANPLLRH